MNKYLIWILLFSLIAKVQAQTLPPVQYYWDVYQFIPVQFVNWTEEEKADFIEYAKSRLDPLDLDVHFVWDRSVRRPDGLSEGIKLINQEGTTTVCAKTSTTWGVTADYKSRTRLQTIKLDTTCKGYTRKDNRIFWLNVMMHEFLHALWIGHLQYIKDVMPVPLMKSPSSTELQWTYNDEWQLHQRYHRNKILKYQGINFKHKDLGKTCYLIQGDKSVSFPVDTLFKRVTGLKGEYKKVVR